MLAAKLSQLDVVHFLLSRTADADITDQVRAFGAVATAS
jgi:hypothetical protein